MRVDFSSAILGLVTLEGGGEIRYVLVRISGHAAVYEEYPNEESTRRRATMIEREALKRADSVVV